MVLWKAFSRGDRCCASCRPTLSFTDINLILGCPTRRALDGLRFECAQPLSPPSSRFRAARCPPMALLPARQDSRAQRARSWEPCGRLSVSRGTESWELAAKSSCVVIQRLSSDCAWNQKAWHFEDAVWT